MAVILISLLVYSSQIISVSSQKSPTIDSEQIWATSTNENRKTRLCSYDTENVDGTMMWNLTIGQPDLSHNTFPVIDSDGIIYIGTKGQNDTFYAIYPNGTIKWNYHTGSIDYGSPTIGDDGTIYVGSSNGKLYAFNPDGTLKWSYSTTEIPYSEGVISTRALVGDNGNIFFADFDGNLYSLNADGDLRWKVNIGTTNIYHVLQGTDGTIYFNDIINYTIYAIRNNGEMIWTYEKGILGTIGDDGTLYITSANNSEIQALDRDKNILWTYTSEKNEIFPSAIGADGSIYVSTSDGRILQISEEGILKREYNLEKGDVTKVSAVDSEGRLYIIQKNNKEMICLNPDGTVKWTYEFPSIPYSVEIGGKNRVCVITRDSTIYAFGGKEIDDKGIIPNISLSLSILICLKITIIYQIKKYYKD